MSIRSSHWPVQAAAVFLLLAFSTGAHADNATSLGRFGDWSSYSYKSKAGTVCYTAALPKRSLNAPRRRSEVYFSVTDRTTERSAGVISVTEGYSFKKDSAAEVDVDGAKFDLYTSADSAWARDDKAVVQAMLKGKSMLVYGTPVSGRQVVDTYSLDGFGKALTQANQACGVK